MAPVYRDGDVVIVSPAAPVRPGDRVVLRSRAGEVMAKELARSGLDRVELRSLNPVFPDRSFAPQEIHWMSRILWAGQ